MDHHQRRRRADGRQAGRDPGDATGPDAHQRLPQHPGGRRPPGLRGLALPGRDVPDPAPGPRQRDPLLRPGSGRPPDRGGPVDAAGTRLPPRPGDPPMRPLRYAINVTLDGAKEYVVSSTLDRVDWNAELVQGDVGKAVE